MNEQVLLGVAITLGFLLAGCILAIRIIVRTSNREQAKLRGQISSLQGFALELARRFGVDGRGDNVMFSEVFAAINKMETRISSLKSQLGKPRAESDSCRHVPINGRFATVETEEEFTQNRVAYLKLDTGVDTNLDYLVRLARIFNELSKLWFERRSLGRPYIMEINRSAMMSSLKDGYDPAASAVVSLGLVALSDDEPLRPWLELGGEQGHEVDLELIQEVLAEAMRQTSV